MSLIVYSQPRTPLTSTYIALGFVSGVAVLRQFAPSIPIDSAEGLIFIAAVAGFISSCLFF